MQILAEHLLSSAFSSVPRAPDDPIAADPGDAVVLSGDPPAPEPIAADPAGSDPAPEPAPAPAPAARPEPPKWALERISEETSRRQEAEERARVATERAQALEEITRRLQANPADPAKPAPAAPAPSAADATVQQEVARQMLQRDIVNLDANGAAAYGPQWKQAADALTTYGCNTPAFLASVMEAEPAKAHEIVFQIAQDPALAVAMAKMTPVRLAREITRMTMAQAEPKPAPAPAAPAAPQPALSRAPAPRAAPLPHASAPEANPTTAEGDAKLSGEQWNEWFQREGFKTLFRQAG